MSQRRSRSDDVLFISALAAILLGAALLLYTTGAFAGALRSWPLLVIGAGGVLLYIALVRRASYYFLFGGLLFVLEGAFFLAAAIMGWKLARAWPLCMAIAGLSGLAAGGFSLRRLKVFYAVPSVSFLALGLLFSVFSFRLAGISFATFIAVWWPTVLIAGGVALFIAYGISRRGVKRRARTRGPSRPGT
jgi:hypothetical protein